MNKYVCEKCGSEDVDQRVWVNLNTEQIMDLSSGEIEDNWCNDCGEHCEIKFVKDD